MNENDKDLLKTWLSGYKCNQTKKQIVFSYKNFILFKRKYHIVQSKEDKFEYGVLYSLHDLDKSTEENLKYDIGSLEVWDGRQNETNLINNIVKKYIRKR